MALLDQIVVATRKGLPELRARRADLEAAVGRAGVAPPFGSRLRGRDVGIIAEVKRRSPSIGVINDRLDPTTLAGMYQEAGASAVSVLTNREHFGGSIDDLVQVASAITIPVVRKDFVLDEVQLLEARAAGAAAALLIVRILPDDRLSQLVAFARSIGLEVLVEAHRREEVGQALDAGADLVGVNARDLDTLAIDAPSAWELFALIPARCVAVAESGMRTAADVAAAADAGADAVLIGSALSGAASPGAELKHFIGHRRRGR